MNPESLKLSGFIIFKKVFKSLLIQSRIYTLIHRMDDFIFERREIKDLNKANINVIYYFHLLLFIKL